MVLASPLGDARNVCEHEMKSIVLTAFGGPENFELQELPLPPVREGEIRVRVRAISFNPVDCQIRSGRTEASRLKSMVLGRDFSGTVEAVHETVRDIAVDDEVFGNVCRLASSGTYAQVVSMPAELVAKKPPGLSHEQAAAIPVAGLTASIALRKAAFGRGKSLFLAGGAGGVGTFVALLAARIDAGKVFATVGSAASRSYLSAVAGLPIEQLVDYRAADFAARAIQANGGPFDGAIDLVGGAMLGACCQLVALNGNVVSATEAPSVEDFEFLFDRNASFHPVGTHAHSLSTDRRDWNWYRTTLQQLAQCFGERGLPEGTVRVVGSFSPDTVAHAHRLLEARQVRGKLVMSC